ncbi:Aldo-keto reductase family 1 member A1 [Lamellibrachia satsuma]|nr:Aldo-keto reductase family 1 member A1 [Lamellibrachia satsuma]
MASRGFVLLNNGIRMPSIGLGTYQANKDSMQAAVDYALNIGYQHIDTACSYGNEADIGEVLDRKLCAGAVKRNNLFITTKVPIDRLGERDTERTVQESLDFLRLKYLDLVLVHAPWGHKKMAYKTPKERKRPTETEFIRYDLVKTWHVLENLVRRGLIRSIGLSNFTQRQVEHIWKNAEIKPANLQLECHAYLQQLALRTYCCRRSIAVTGYAPLGAPSRPARYTHHDDLHLLSDPVILDIAKQLGRTPAQILLRFLLQLGVSPLPKSVHPKRIAENIQLFDFTMGNVEMDQLRALNRNMKFYRFPWFQNHPEYYENEEF